MIKTVEDKMTVAITGRKTDLQNRMMQTQKMKINDKIYVEQKKMQEITQKTVEQVVIRYTIITEEKS
ncbi:MAG: hypothetical protein ACLRYY_12215 [Anaerobutyricum soehngenii]